MSLEDDAFKLAKSSLAANIAALRAKRGWTQDKLAEAAGLDPKHLQKLEYRALNPTLRTLVRIASALGVSLPALLRRSRRRAPDRPVGRPRVRRRVGE